MKDLLQRCAGWTKRKVDYEQRRGESEYAVAECLSIPRFDGHLR